MTEPELRQVQHFWFLISLVLYTIICWPIFVLRERIARAVPHPRLLLAALVIASAAAVVLLKPHPAALTGENYQFVLDLIFFLKMEDLDQYVAAQVDLKEFGREVAIVPKILPCRLSAAGIDPILSSSKMRRLVYRRADL